ISTSSRSGSCSGTRSSSPSVAPRPPLHGRRARIRARLLKPAREHIFSHLTLFLFCSNALSSLTEPNRVCGGAMSIEIFALSDRRLGSMAEWQQAIDREGFDLKLSQSRPIESLSGHLPAKRGDEHAGFECDHWDPAELLDAEELADIDFGHRWTQ